jgi:hypothetical protein
LVLLPLCGVDRSRSLATFSVVYWKKESEMFENLKSLASAAIVGGGILATASGCHQRDEYGCCTARDAELAVGCRAEILAEKMASPETKDSHELAVLKSAVISTLAAGVDEEIKHYQKGNSHGSRKSHLVQQYLARCEGCGLSAEFPPSLVKSLEMLRNYRERSETSVGDPGVEGSSRP